MKNKENPTFSDLKEMYINGELKDENWIVTYDETGKPIRWYPGTYIRDCIAFEESDIYKNYQRKLLWDK